MKTALITGITGQDGSYLAELLLSKGYEVHGLVRRASSPNTARIAHIANRITIHYGDLSDSDQINPIMTSLEPAEVYNLAAQSHGGLSFEMPEYTGNIDGLGVTRVLEAIRKNSPKTKIYQASTSEMFGAATPPQNELTEFNPSSPYSCSKLYAYWMMKNYRDAYKTFAVNGILFNHESPRRGEAFVTRKITMGIANILAGNQKHLELGNMHAMIDWGFAPEYVEVMWKTLQQKEPDDYVIGTGETHTVAEFVNFAFAYAGLDPQECIKFVNGMMRPIDRKILQANSKKARALIGWKPKVLFNDLIAIMVDADLRKVGLPPVGRGDAAVKHFFKNKWWIGD